MPWRIGTWSISSRTPWRMPWSWKPRQGSSGSTTNPGRRKMANTHPNHDHQHGPDCGHKAVKHDGHVDYLHDGHLHHQNGGTVEEHALAVGGANPAACTPAHSCGG